MRKDTPYTPDNLCLGDCEIPQYLIDHINGIISESEGLTVPLTCRGLHTMFSQEIWLEDNDSGVELRIVSNGKRQLTISRVFLCNTRQGTFTKVMRLLEEFAACHHVPYVLIQSVCTKEMRNWCRKNSYLPQQTAPACDSDDLPQDYKKDIYF